MIKAYPLIMPPVVLSGRDWAGLKPYRVSSCHYSVIFVVDIVSRRVGSALVYQS
jgi:hypothetical protein